MTYLKLLLTAIFWGGTFIAGKFLAGDVNPLDAAFVRFAIASIFLLVITRKLEGRLPRIQAKLILPLILLGATGVFAYNILFFSAFHHINAGKAALIIATNPILISLLSALLFKERLDLIKGAGIIMSVTGAMVVISNGHLTDLVSYEIGRGELLIYGCVASWVAYSLIGKSVMGSLSPLASVCYSSVIGTVFLGIVSIFKGDLTTMGAWSIIDWFSLFYLGFFGTVLGFLWYYEGIREIGPMKASVFINFVPISAILFAWLILGEPVTASLLVGAALVVSGVYSTNASGIIKRYLTAKG
ncbi:conserved hypothetical protein [Desulforapulum autotrophicum HRM2]|uniref:EamA domain-containing protein n=1 Tax=Desulforapulum autotrophicum (strain ATCC 43914 / DSM 3382 / VKM B-1955 / HRM2) TaxID=177437 RepID=C0QHS7_DESAH|nr:DMT family transporter [Desulforapulum autotrophicum]ACN13635.1 conserved hypothetical protein [Desulforapulum autotrophicum HRM2]